MCGRHGRMTLSPRGREQLVAVPSIGRATEVTPRRAAPEADATRDLYERYARQIYSYCLHQLGNREEDRKSTRLNSSHSQISYAVFCLKKKKQQCQIPLSYSL